MKNILFVTHQLSRTGAPIVLMDMMNVCIEAGCSVSVISLLDGELKEELERRSIPVTIRDRFMEDADEIRNYAKAFDCVVANTLLTYELIHVLNGEKVPVVWWLHEGCQYFEYFKNVLPDFKRLKENIKVYSVGHYVSSILKEKYDYETRILHMGVRDRSDALAEMENGIWEEYDCGHKKTRLFVAGTFSKVKAQDVLCKAAELMDEEIFSRCELVFCGNTDMYDDEVFGSVRELAAGHPNVHIPGLLPHDEVIKLMAGMDFLVVPSRIDPIPTVAVEAMMMKKPCIITDVCGVAHYLYDGVNALLCKMEDVASLKASLVAAVDMRENNRAAYDAMAECARRVYDRYFSMDIFKKKTGNLLGISAECEKLICMTGVYDILDIFTYELIREFSNMGYEVMEFDTKNMEKSLGKLYDFIKTPVKAVITFNNLGYNMELVPGQNLWEQLNIPCINILMDHPFCHKKALDASPYNAIVLCPDRNHMKYLQRFYPQIPIVGFLPHGGKNKRISRKPVGERKIDVLYAGGISRGFVAQYMPDFSEFDFDARAVADESYRLLINNPYMTTEDAIERVLLSRNICLTDEKLCDVIEKLHYIDLLAVSYYREKTIRTLVENGVRVRLYGTGWEVCDWLDNPNLSYMGRVSAEKIVDTMADSKIVLSTMTWFKDGTHDRVFNGMLAGAVAVTDSSVYMKEEFTDGKDIVMFELPQIDGLPATIKELLNNPERMQRIADEGFKSAVKSHTWEERAWELQNDLLSISSSLFS